MNNGRPSTREWEGETWDRNHYGVVLNDGNRVNQDQSRYERGRRSRVNGVPKEMARGCGIHIFKTKHMVRTGRGIGDGAMRLKVGQHQDQGTAGYETHRRHSHATEIGLHGMGNGCRESITRGYRHRLEGRRGMGG